MSSAGVARVRRTKETAKEAILDAAENLFLRHGPIGVRVQTIASAVGVRDATVHYHFGNRAGVMKSLLRRMARRLVNEIGRASAGEGEEAPDIRKINDALKRILMDDGAARMMVALALAGWRPRRDGMMAALIDDLRGAPVAHASEKQKATRDREGVENVLILIIAAYVALGVVGEAIFRSVGADDDQGRRRRFCDWLTEISSGALGRM